MPSQKVLADPTSLKGAVTTMPMVDVNLVTYNHEKFVVRAIESVLEQKTDFDYRLIIGDDCSTDNTQSIIRDYAQQYPERIQVVLATEHRGIEHKDRMGIEVLRLSTAKYVTLLDGDDYWTDPRRLQKLMGFLESHPECSVAFHDARLFYEDGSEASRRLYPPDLKEISSLQDMLTTSCFPIPCTALFRREALGELPDCFFRVTNADWMLFVLLAEHGTLGYINEVMAAYRVHSGGVWSGLDPIQGTREHIKTYETIDAHLNFKYTRAISKKIIAWRKALTRQQAQSCLAQYHRAVKNGEMKKGLRLLLQATLSAPLQVFRPRHFAAVLKNGFLGLFYKERIQN